MNGRSKEISHLTQFLKNQILQYQKWLIVEIIDESGLFYKCVINKTFLLRAEKSTSEKFGKIRLTG